uniref:Uncharacterized protein n=1 Tax=Anopheles arabiensis TaxID=7173 RepID=A0A182IH54_ANOAR
MSNDLFIRRSALGSFVSYCKYFIICLVNCSSSSRRLNAVSSGRLLICLSLSEQQ